MRYVIFCHSLVSDWNHGNAHFLRGIVAELGGRGHRVDVFEPAGGWSRTNLRADAGEAAEAEVRTRFPDLVSHEYDLDELDLDRVLDGADVVLAHEWNDPALIARLGARRAAGGGFRLFFHDTHHRAVTDPTAMGRYDLSGFDGVLAFGEAIRRIYLERGWAERAWTWHEAADTRVFAPPAEAPEPAEDLVWVGNWGDGERTAELETFLFDPVRRLGLTGSIYGVRYPESGRAAVAAAGLRYRGWLANHRVPSVFAEHRFTVHVPRRPYAAALPGIPTIRVFEALACGIPLLTAPWDDAERLFDPGDLVMVESGEEMAEAMRGLLEDPAWAGAVASCGRRTVLARHTCAHRVDELEGILAELGRPAERRRVAA